MISNSQTASSQVAVERNCWCGGFLEPSVNPFYGKCEQCGTLVLKRTPTAEDLKKYYSLQGYWYEHQLRDCGFPDIEKRATADLADRIPVWHSLLTQAKSKIASLLEIGCAHGGFLNYCRERGVQKVVGVEVDEDTCRFAREHFNLPHVCAGLFPTVELPLERFDAVAGFDVLEHFLDPITGLKSVASLLGDESVFIFQTPCYRGEDGKWSQFKPSEHIFLYNTSSIRALCERADLEIVDLVPGYFPDDMFVIGRKKVAATRTPFNNANRILFVRTDSIGDAVLASSMLEPIRKKNPNAKLAILCQQHVAELFITCPFVDSIICYDRKKMDIPSERGQILAEITAFNPDTILNSVRSRDKLSNELTTAFGRARHIAIESDLANISEADRVQSLRKYELLIPSPGAQKTEFARHGDFLGGLGIGSNQLQPLVWTTPADEKLAEAFFKQENLDPQRALAFFPFTQHDTKNYPKFADALKLFSDWTILILGGDERQESCEKLARQLSGKVFNLAGRTTLREMAAIIRRCRILVGGDSCAAHIACAVGVPNVVLLGGGQFGRFLPYSPLTSAVSLPLDCFNCNWNCPHQRAHCVKDVAPEVLAEAIQQTLKNNSPRPRIFLQSSESWAAGAGLPAWKNPSSLLKEMEVEIIEVAVPRADLPMKSQAEQSVTSICPVCQTAALTNIVKKGQPYHLCPTCDCVFTLHIDANIIQTENNGHAERHCANQDALRLQRLMTALKRRPELVIDFGCGEGEMTRFIQSQGINTTGIDQDTAVQLKEIADNTVDGIMMVEVIEHLPDPHLIFSQFNRVLKLGGVVYVESSFADKKELAAWNYLDPAIGHCTVHSLRSMDLIAQKNGFGISWLNSNVCCLAKKAALKPAVQNSTLPDDIEIVGEGISDPAVTVVVSTYQSEKFIRPCLENLARLKNFDHYEIVVIDSGSPENEKAVIAEFQKKFPNIRYVRTPRETLYGAWNRGLKLARGRYCANVNTDDGLRDDALEILTAALDQHSDCALAYADCAWTTKSNDAFPSTNLIRMVKYPDYAPVEILFYCITGCLQFWRTNAIRQLGGFDASLRCAGDYEATLKMMAAGLNAVHVPEVLSLFYQNTGGLTQSSNRATIEHDEVTNRYRAKLDIGKIFRVQPGSVSSSAHAWAMLGNFACRFIVPWEDKFFSQRDFAITCLQQALIHDPENEMAGVNLASLYLQTKRLEQMQPELTQRWPKMKKWIADLRANKISALPNLAHAVLGPAYYPTETAARPTAEELAGEPESIRPWIGRMDDNYVYVSENFFHRSAGLLYETKELEAIAKKTADFLTSLPPFYMHFGGAGDALLLLATFLDKHPDATVVSCPNSIPAAHSLFDAFPSLKRIWFLPPIKNHQIHLLLRMLMRHVPNCLGKGVTPEMDYFTEWHDQLDIFKEYKVIRHPEWIKKFRNAANAKQITLAPKGSLMGMAGSKRNIIDPKIWPYLLKFIQQSGFQPVIIGTPDEAKFYPAIPGCYDRRSHSFHEQMEEIANSAGVIAADSWAKTFSALAEIPTIVFDPLKGADWMGKKDPADFVFIDPWNSITVVKNLDQCREVFSRIFKTTVWTTNGKSKPVIAWLGSFLDHGSLSHVNRELTGALRTFSDIQINRVTNGSAASPGFENLAGEISTMPSPKTALTVRHAWPPNWKRPASGKLAVIQPWEFGTLPADWVRLARDVDEFWVPTHFVRNSYVESGVNAEKVFVVPNGVDAEKFHPQAAPMKLATQKKFKFLFVGGTIGRKGPDLLLQAYLENFTAADDVCLVIKDFGGKSFYSGQTFESQIRAAQVLPGAPEILYLNAELPPETLPGLYTACHCFVLPYRGEGFGLPVLEAMSCGLPVIVTAGGATDDFARDEFAWRIPAEKRVFGTEVGGMKLAGTGWLLEPNLGALGEKMRHAFDNPIEAQERGKLASRHAHRAFSWKNSATMAAQRIRALTTLQVAPIKPAKTIPVVLPPVAKVGQLTEARELLRLKQFQAAWAAAAAALARRPFHPEAFLLLGEIASAVNDGANAKLCAQLARKLAPGWSAPKQFLKKSHHGNAKPEWLNLPKTNSHRPSAAGISLSVCLIVKNEERFLAQCLKSIHGFAQQIIVVDTGSTDRTMEIAREFNAEIHAFTWCDDFSAARNAALEHVTGDWVLMLDADEELPMEQHANLLADMKRSEAIAYRLPLINREHEAEGRDFVPRLFRNAPGAFYSGRIHEQVFPSLLANGKAWGLKTALGTAEILHHGYTKELVRDRNKI